MDNASKKEIGSKSVAIVGWHEAELEFLPALPKATSHQEHQPDGRPTSEAESPPQRAVDAIATTQSGRRVGTMAEPPPRMEPSGMPPLRSGRAAAPAVLPLGIKCPESFCFGWIHQLRLKCDF